MTSTSLKSIFIAAAMETDRWGLCLGIRFSGDNSREEKPALKAVISIHVPSKGRSFI